MAKPILITKSFVDFAGEKYPAWQMVTARPSCKQDKPRFPYTASVKDLDYEKAKKLIKEHGLVQVCKNNFGEVYDTPDQAFKELYNKKIYIRI